MSETVLSIWRGPISITPRERWQRIAKEVADRHGLTLDDLVGPLRDQKRSRARHEAMYIIRNSTNYSLPRIASLFGDRDHTTVLHGLRRHKERMLIE